MIRIFLLRCFAVLIRDSFDGHIHTLHPHRNAVQHSPKEDWPSLDASRALHMLGTYHHSRVPHSNNAGFIACRFFIGLCEGPVFPGLVLYLSDFYRRDEIPLRIAILYGAAATAGAIGGLLAAVIQPLYGTAGLGLGRLAVDFATRGMFHRRFWCLCSLGHAELASRRHHVHRSAKGILRQEDFRRRENNRK